MTGHKREKGGRPVLRITCFLIVGTLLFLSIQNVLTLNWPYPNPSPFNVLEEAEPSQILFLGSSHIYSSVLPIEIYEQFGITTLDLASPGQQMQMSYSLLEEALKKWTPKVVAIEAEALLEGPTPDLSYWLLALTDTPAFTLKLHSAKIYAEAAEWYSEDIDYNEALLGAMVPSYQFHSRWSELSRDDFIKNDTGLKASITKGGLIRSGVEPTEISVDGMNSVAAGMVQENDAWATYMLNGEVGQENLDEELIYSPKLDEYDVRYFEKIVRLCKEKQIALTLIKIPTLGNPVARYNSWTWQKHKLITQFAQETEIPFLDLLYDVNLGIDWINDTYDGGNHTNIRGARKISAYLGQYLKDAYQITGTKSTSYDWALPWFRMSESLAMQQTERELGPWLDWIQNSGRDLTVAMAVCEDMTLGLTPENIQTLQKIGLKTDFGNLSFGDTFLAIWEHRADGTNYIPYETASNRELTYEYEMPDGTSICLLSRGGYQYANVSIKVNDLEQTWVIRGLHFMVFDRESGLVLDDMWVDFSIGGTIIHWNSHEYLSNYEQWINEVAGSDR